MVTQLGRTLRGEKGILKMSIDTHRNGWERVPRSHQCWYSQEVLCLRAPEERLVKIENSNGRFWQEKKKEKRKWEVKLKTWKGGLTTKRIPRLKTWKGGLGRRKLIKGVQGMESYDNQASLVCGKAEFDICSKKTKDIGRGAIRDRIYGLLT